MVGFFWVIRKLILMILFKIEDWYYLRLKIDYIKYLKLNIGIWFIVMMSMCFGIFN